VTVNLRRPLSAVNFAAKSTNLDVLGNGWVDGHTWDPSVYEPLGIREGGVVISDPQARGIPYGTDQTENPPSDGAYLGIGCAWRQTIHEAPTVKVTWAGYLNPDHTEGAACINFVPGTSEHCFGVWASEFLGSPALLFATIGNPPEDVDIIAVGGFSHTEGTPREIEIRSNGTGATGWVDGVQVSMSGGYNLNPVPIPSALLGSTMHGLALDCHFVTPANIPTLPVVRNWSIS
jgi:hypothetical protein